MQFTLLLSVNQAHACPNGAEGVSTLVFREDVAKLCRSPTLMINNRTTAVNIFDIVYLYCVARHVRSQTLFVL